LEFKTNLNNFKLAFLPDVTGQVSGPIHQIFFAEPCVFAKQSPSPL